MIIFGRTISRLTLGVLGIILILALVAFGTSQCSKRKSVEAQSRMDKAQTDAAIASGKDASQVQADVNRNETASETLGRQNERTIRNAQGSNAVVAPGANAAGLRAVCRRKAYSDSERCRLLNAR